MKRIISLVIILSVVLLMASRPDEYKVYVESKTPVGEVVSHFEGEEEYYCVCDPENIPDDAKILDKIYKKTKPGLFHTYREVEQELTELATDFPEKCELRIIGTTHEKRNIYALRFFPGSIAPGFLFVGAHHAREWMSVEIPLELCHYLAKNPDDDPRVSEWLSKYDIWVIPMLNPDGHQFSIDEDRMWRKNRFPSLADVGVDPNRNYSYHWGGTGASGDPSSQVYYGEYAFSELETQAMRELFSKVPMIGCLTYHTYGDLILYPWGYADEKAPWEDEMQELAIGLAEKTGPPDDDDNKKKTRLPYYDTFDYIPIKGSQLYPAAGEMCDYLYSQHGTVAFTIEIGDRKTGFIPEDDRIQPTIEQTLDLNFFMLDEVSKEFCVVEGFIRNTIGTVPNAKIYLGKSFLELTPDPITGYYYRVLPKGKHLVRAEWAKNDVFRELVEFNENLNHFDLTWNRMDGLFLQVDILDEFGGTSSTMLTLIDSDGNTIETGFYEKEFRFENLKKAEYSLIVNQFEMEPREIKIDLIWDLRLPVVVVGSPGY